MNTAAKEQQIDLLEIRVIINGTLHTATFINGERGSVEVSLRTTVADPVERSKKVVIPEGSYQESKTIVEIASDWLNGLSK